MAGLNTEVVQLAWSRMLDVGEYLDFYEGQVVFYEGHFPMGLFFLISGRLSLRSKSFGDSPRVLEAEMVPLIGMDFFITQLPFPYTAIVEEQAQLLFIPRSQLLQLRVGEMRS